MNTKNRNHVIARNEMTKQSTGISMDCFANARNDSQQVILSKVKNLLASIMKQA
jgi:hypothetical protein